MRAERIYAILAPVWDVFALCGGHAREARAFVSAVPLPPDAPLRILDFGCGTGLHAFAALRRFPRARVTAVDASAAMIRQLERTALRRGLEHRLTTITGSFHALRASGAQPFDLIIAAGVLEHLDLRDSLQRFRTMLRPGGFLLITRVRANAPGTLMGKLFAIRPYAAEDLHATARELGFSLRESLRLPSSPAYFPANIMKEGDVFVAGPDSAASPITGLRKHTRTAERGSSGD